MIKRFVRTGKKQGKKVGVLIAVVNDDNKIVIGHSKWNRKIDPYNPAFGEKVATKRIESDSSVEPASSITREYVDFARRAIRYFKGAELSEGTTKALTKASLELAAREAAKHQVDLGSGC